MSENSAAGLLGAGQIRDLAGRLGVRPTKKWGQNFVIDANTVRRIVRLADVGPHDVVVEIGPGLGSLTLALLPQVSRVLAVEVDPNLAKALPDTVARFAPAYRDRLDIVLADAMTVSTLPDPQPTALVANLPYNISVPVVLSFLEAFPTLRRVLVMVQLEVAERLAAPPGSKTYGIPSLKAAWYADVGGDGERSDKGFLFLTEMTLTRREPPRTPASRKEVFACIDAAFAQRRKTLRAALSGWAGSAADAETALRNAGVDPRTRGEQLDIHSFAAITAARSAMVAQ
jgi:16S rRNA (adenine1518-N6/adenine1519-N6)-dimethyltransferase